MFNRLFLYFLFFFLGLAVGSFLNCLIYRLEVGNNFLKGRSYCPKCKHILNWKDLIPLLSFFILKGKCRYCGEKISWQYPLVELATGVLFILIANNQLAIINFQNLLSTLYSLLSTCFLIVIFVFDFKHYIIPDKIIYPLILLAFIWLGLNSIFFNAPSQAYLLNPIFSALGAGAFFLSIVLISKGEWMGLGDVKLAFFMGLFLAFPNIIVALFLASLTGAIIGLSLVIAGKKSLKSEVPFAPFLVGGTFLVLFWGKELINWYFSFFNVYNLNL